MNFKTFNNLIKEDINIYYNLLIGKKTKDKLNIIDFIRIWVKSPVFKLVYFMRLNFFLRGKKFFLPLFILTKFYYRHLQIKFGVQIGYDLNPGGGFFLGHYSGIVVHSYSQIGDNLIIHQGVTIGTTDRGVPKIGNNVTIGANVCIIGEVIIGDNCTIGAGSIITKSFANNSVIVGNPARLLRTKAKEEHVF